MKNINISLQFWLMLTFLSFGKILLGQGADEMYIVVEYPAMASSYCPVDKHVDESSGLIKIGDALWTFNDSGGKAEIYRIDTKTGDVAQTVSITNATNVDWESIASDIDFIYIGDFGNNLGNRHDQKIYKIQKNKISNNTKISIQAEVIAISFADQQSFEIKNRKNDYDCESVISYGDQLLLFSKNWSNGKTRMYTVSKNPGEYQLRPIDRFDVDGLITGASLNRNTSDLALIGYKDHVPFIYLFKNFDGKKLGTNKVYRINLNKMKEAQTEGICFEDDDRVLFSTEQTKVFDQQVFELDLAKILKAINPN